MIECVECKTMNAPNSMNCSECGENLLPGRPLRQRLFWFGIAFLILMLGLILASQFPPQKSSNPMGLPSGNDTIAAIIFFGALGGSIFFLSRAFGRTPLHEKYLLRAQRHEGIDNKQAETDYSEAIRLSPKDSSYYQKRGLFYEKIGEPEKARNDMHLYFVEHLKFDKALLRTGEKILGGVPATVSGQTKIIVTNKRIIVKPNLDQLRKKLLRVFEGEIDLKDIVSVSSRRDLAEVRLVIGYKDSAGNGDQVVLNGAGKLQELIQDLTEQK